MCSSSPVRATTTTFLGRSYHGCSWAGRRPGLSHSLTSRPNTWTSNGTDRLYVLDALKYRVVAFDSTGAHLWSAGSEGRGPSEFSAPVEVFSTLGNGVAVVDAVGMKIEYFDQRLLLVSGSDTSEIARIRLAPQARLAFERCPVRVALPPLLGAELRWAASPNRLAVVTGPEYVVDIYSRGVRTGSFRRDIEPVTATAELASAEVPEGMTLGGGAFVCDVSAREAVEKRGFGWLVPTIRGGRSVAGARFGFNARRVETGWPTSIS